MAAAGEASSSWVPPPLPECGVAPGSILLDMRCYIADLPNGTTATSVTSRRLPIHVTFREASPPALSHLCVHCPGADFPAEAPKVVATHADLVLLRVPLNPDALFSGTTRYWDYFVYRAHPPRLDLLPNPYPKPFNDSEAALLSLEDGGYVLASLRNRIPRRDSRGGALIMTEFDLYLYRSSNADEGWVTKRLSVEKPVRDTLVPLPRAVADNMLFHETTKTITVGGEHGTVAWVDLWRGIILCDVLVECPLLHDIPLPLPAKGNWDRLLQEYNPNYLRDITISRHKNSIKYIEMELGPPKEPEKTTRESYLDWVRQNRRTSLARRDGWKATIWTMPIPVASWEEWHREHDVDVDDLSIDASKPWLYMPLSNLKGSDTKAILRRISVAYPTISMDEDEVYLLSKVDELEVVVAVDVKKKALQGVAELDTQKNFYLMPTYCSSEISSYLKETTGTLEALKPTEKEELKLTKVHVKELTSRMKHGNKQVWRRRPLHDAIQSQLV